MSEPQQRRSRDPTTGLRQAILEGQFFPNERLIEEDLVRRFGGTRHTIRLALAVLEQQGLVAREPHRGARVRLVSEQEAVEIMETRAVVESLTARHAAENATPEDVTRLRAMLAHLESLSAAQDLVGYSASNVGLHVEIARLSRHSTAERILNGLRSQTVAFQFRPILEPGRAAENDAEHRALVDAIARRDGPQAEAAMRAHLDRAVVTLKAAIKNRRLVQVPPARLPEPTSW
jgi:DNA-binding GntR family transcriptional regulator